MIAFTSIMCNLWRSVFHNYFVIIVMSRDSHNAFESTRLLHARDGSI